jgi:hypothetical protein
MTSIAENQTITDMVIEALAADEAGLRDRIIDLTLERNTYRELAILALRGLYRLTRERDRLREQLREYRRHDREAA